MTKAKAARKTENRARKRPSRSKTIDWKKLFIVGGSLLGFAVLVYLAQSTSGSPVDAEVAQIARENAGTDVRVLRGSHHTVYHSNIALPTSKEPRGDGKSTLVWFSGTWCELCEHMETFAHTTAEEFQDSLVFVEKSVDHDQSAAGRYGVRGTPTFVLIDEEGREQSRFSFQSSSSSFRAAISQALKRAGGGS